MTDNGNRLAELSAEERRALLAEMLESRGERLRVRPASFAQRRMWFLDRMGVGAAYNLANTFAVRGDLDVEALQRSVAAIVERHETLRTTFAAEGGVPRQVIAAVVRVPLVIRDVSDLPEEEREAAADKALSDDARQSFDLAEGPLLRALLVRLGERHHVFQATAHHIVTDGWSQGIFRRELAEHYRSFRAGEAPSVSELEGQYADFAQAQDAWLGSADRDKQLDYWKARLDQPRPLTALVLPTDHARPAQQTFAGAAVGLHLTPEQTARLRDLAGSQDVTLAMLLMATFQVLLARHCGQDDIAIGSPIAGRNRREVEDLIGFFVNMLVLRTDLSGDPAFTEVLRRVRDVALGAYEHQDLPFECLVDELAPERDMSRSPLVQVVFAVQNVGVEPLQLEGLDVELLAHDASTTRFDLEVYLSDAPAGLSGRFVYNPDLFDASTVERLVEHYRRLLQDVVARPDARVSELAMLGDEELRQLADFGDASAEFAVEERLHERFERQVQRTPHAVAVIWEDETLTYSELNARANGVARLLREHGVEPEVLVGLAVERGLELVVGLIGVLKAGGGYLPLDLVNPSERIAFLLQDASVSVIVGSRHSLDRLPSHDATEVCLDDVATDEDVSAAGDPADLAYVIYTSGSTGKPKGVPVEHRAVLRLFDATAGWFEFGAGDTWTLFHSHAFDFSVWELWGALLHGGRLVVVPQDVTRSPAEFHELLCAQQVTVLNQTPSAFRQLIQADEGAAGELALRLVIFGGEALELQSLRPWFERHGDQRPRLVNMYGITETTVHVTYRPLDWTDLESGRGSPIGRPIPDVSVRVLDRQRRPMTIGATGELYVGGAGVARGYLGREQLTAERFVEDPVSGERLYRTGDLGRFGPDGDLEYLGRNDDQVQLRGHRIELGEIEAVLAGHSRVRAAVAVVRDHGEGDQRLVVYAEHSGGEADDLRSWLEAKLPAYMVPSAIVALEQLPLTPHGKIDRAALPSPGELPRTQRIAPRNPEEEAIAEIWAHVLELPAPGVSESFFELGGHSLLATQVVSRIRDVLGVEIPVRAFFEHPTIAGLAELVRSRDGLSEAASPITPAKRDGPLPLSFAQRRLWFLDQIGVGAAYNIAYALRLVGDLDRDRLKRCLDAVVQRHEALRTHFPAADGEPVQEVSASLSLPMSFIDLSEVRDAERDLELARRRQHEETEPFDLATGPLLRPTMIRLGAREHVLLLTVHHIAFDGWSVGVLNREITEHYRALGRGEVAVLPELRVQVPDVSVWQCAEERGPHLKRQVEHWCERLAGLAPLDLPTDRPRPAEQTFSGAANTFALPADAKRSLQDLGRVYGVTPAMILLALFKVWLARYTGQVDVSVGSPVAGRTRREIEDLIGFFVNTLVLRTDLSGDPRFSEVLGRVRQTCLDAYEHQEVPFEHLVEALEPARDLSRSPLFQVLFAVQNAPGRGVELEGLEVSYLDRQTGSTRFDLELHYWENDAGLTGRVIYNCDLFDGSTIERLSEHLVRLLVAVVEDPGIRLSAMPLLTAEERHRMLFDWNETSLPAAAACVHELVEVQVTATPQAVAVRDGEFELTYAELDARANRLAHYLRERGVGADVRVAILLSRSADVVVALLGTCKAGAAYVPLDPELPAERLAFMLEDCSAAVVLTEEAHLAAVAGHRESVVSLDRDAPAIAEQPATKPDRIADPDHLAYVLYTSGSTGRPKGVAMPHAALVNLLRWQNEVSPPGAADRTVQFGTLSFDQHFLDIFATLSSGGTVLMIGEELRRDPAALLEFLERSAVTRMFLPYVALRQLAEVAAESDSVPRSLRLVISAGEALRITPSIGEFFAGIPGCVLCNEYGPAETHVVTALDLHGDPRAWPALPTVGRPIFNSTAYILDAQLQPVPVGATGELYLGGVQVARGYLGRPALTAERFVCDPFAAEPGARLYRTGDLARYRRDGSIEYRGRNDHQIKIRGFRIELGEVEIAILAHPAVRQAVADVRETASGDRRLVAWVVVEPDQTLSPAELRSSLRQSLPDYMLPSTVAILDALPLTPTGKIDRRALPAPSADGVAAQAYVAPRNDAEEKLGRIWSEVLSLERVGIHDNFFDLGGHSLLATKVISRIETGFDLRLPLQHLFRFPTVAELAEEIGTIGWLAGASSTERAATSQPTEEGAL